MPASFRELRNTDPQFAGEQLRCRASRIARYGKTNRAREATIATLDEVKTRVAAATTRRFLAGNEQRAAFGHDADAGGVDTRQVDCHFQALVCFENVQRG